MCVYEHPYVYGCSYRYVHSGLILQNPCRWQYCNQCLVLVWQHYVRLLATGKSMSCSCQTQTGDPHRRDSCENSRYPVHLLSFSLNILKSHLSFQLVCYAGWQKSVLKKRLQWVLKSWRLISCERGLQYYLTLKAWYRWSVPALMFAKIIEAHKRTYEHSLGLFSDSKTALESTYASGRCNKSISLPDVQCCFLSLPKSPCWKASYTAGLPSGHLWNETLQLCICVSHLHLQEMSRWRVDVQI